MKTNKFSLVVLVAIALSACNTKPAETTDAATMPADSAQTAAAAPAPAPATDGRMCFFTADNRDTTTVSLTITGSEVTGEMVWNPYQKDGAVGTLKGTKNAAGELDLMYSYMIEGSQQSETKIMKIENDQLLIKKGMLEDPKNDGNMRYKDVTKAVFSQKLAKTDCK